MKHSTNKSWLVFGNAKRCNHTKSLHETEFINWTQAHTKFNIGDTIYLFVSDERRIRFELIVTSMNEERQDSSYWIEEAPNDMTFRLELVDEYFGYELDEIELKMHGFKGGRSLQRPMCRNQELFEYIAECFCYM